MMWTNMISISGVRNTIKQISARHADHLTLQFITINTKSGTGKDYGQGTCLSDGEQILQMSHHTFLGFSLFPIWELEPSIAPSTKNSHSEFARWLVTAPFSPFLLPAASSSSGFLWNQPQNSIFFSTRRLKVSRTWLSQSFGHKEWRLVLLQSVSVFVVSNWANPLKSSRKMVMDIASI